MNDWRRRRRKRRRSIRTTNIGLRWKTMRRKEWRLRKEYSSRISHRFGGATEEGLRYIKVHKTGE